MTKRVCGIDILIAKRLFYCHVCARESTAINTYTKSKLGDLESVGSHHWFPGRVLITNNWSALSAISDGTDICA